MSTVSSLEQCPHCKTHKSMHVDADTTQESTKGCCVYCGFGFHTYPIQLLDKTDDEVMVRVNMENALKTDDLTKVAECIDIDPDYPEEAIEILEVDLYNKQTTRKEMFGGHGVIIISNENCESLTSLEKPYLTNEDKDLINEAMEAYPDTKIHIQIYKNGKLTDENGNMIQPYPFRF